MTTAVVISASLAGTRAPGAALELLSDRYALEIMVERARRTPGADLVVCAIPELDGEDPLAEAALEAGALVVRAPDAAPLEGVRRAAAEADAGRVLHVCGVQPFYDPVIAGGVLALLTDTRADIATNAAPALFPDGLDCEAFDSGLLAGLSAGGGERVIDEMEVRRYANLRGPGGGLERLRWRLDHHADIEFARAVHGALGPAACTAGAAEIAGLCLRRPDITAINTAFIDEARLTGGERGAIQTRPVSLLRAA
ncbi:MAG: hypothetical protein RIA71_10800 [Oceanicaulis sp.]